MGCTTSQPEPVREPTPEPVREPTPEPVREPTLEPVREPTPEPVREPTPVNDSDFVISIEDPSSDEVKLEDRPENYNAPKPAKTILHQQLGTSIKWFKNWMPQMTDDVDSGSDDVENNSDKGSQHISFSEGDVDRRAKSAPKSLLQGFPELMQYLTKGLDQSDRPEMLTARSIIVWLSCQDVDQYKQKDGNEDTPEGFLAMLGRKRTTYATFYAFLCRKANLQCTVINGICKAGNYEPGDDEEHRCNWTAVYIEQQWYIVHPMWACRSIVGHQAGGWIKLEEGGKSIGRRQEEVTGVIKTAFQEYYFMTDPSEFIYFCHPDDQNWQLLQRPRTRDQFKVQAYTFPPFFGLGLRLITDDKCALQSVNGQLKIELEAPAKNANALDLWYEILYKDDVTEDSDETNSKLLLDQSNIPRLVAMIRCGEKWVFQIQLPVEGTYKICLFGSPHNNPLLRIAEFRIDCSKSMANCVPLPIDTGIVGFGPGPAAEDAGLHFPTRRNGIYPVKKDETFEMSFNLDKEIIESISVKSSLHKSVSEGNGVVQNVKLQEAVKQMISMADRELKFTANIPEKEDFVLTIHVATTKSGGKFTNVCNYLLKTSMQKTVQKTNQKLAREGLKAAVRQRDDLEDVKYKDRADEIEKAIVKCEKEKISPDDEEIDAARIKVQYLRFRKEIHDAFLRKHVDVTFKTMRQLEQSRFTYTLKEYIDKLRTLHERLKEEKIQKEERKSNATSN